MTPATFSLLVIWYIFCAMLISLVLFTMRGLTHSRFRDDDGDRTTEIGYEEDPVGHELNEQESTTNDSPSEPHISVPATVRPS